MKPLHKEISRLENKLMAISRLAEANINKAVNSLEDHDPVLAKSVVEADNELDNMEVELEEECLKALALYQPVAKDLRFIVAVLKINSDLERVGDLAVNIAKNAIQLAKLPKADLPLAVNKMAYRAWDMVHVSLLSLTEFDKAKAISVLEQDNEVDRMHKRHKTIVREKLATEHTADVSEYLMGCLAASYALERIADHATNIAEDVIYMIDGDIIRHQGPDLGE